MLMHPVHATCIVMHSPTTPEHTFPDKAKYLFKQIPDDTVDVSGPGGTVNISFDGIDYDKVVAQYAEEFPSGEDMALNIVIKRLWDALMMVGYLGKYVNDVRYPVLAFSHVEREQSARNEMRDWYKNRTVAL